MPPRETSRQRTSRIPLDYYKQPDAFARWRKRLSWFAVLATAVWMIGFVLDFRTWPPRVSRSPLAASHGALASVHATWDAECQACHVPFTPIDGSAWTSRFVANPRASDARCATCHNSTLGHSGDTMTEASSCASCHIDHRGRDTSLIAMADKQCTRCHAELAGSLEPGAKSSIHETIARFDPAHHPEFRMFLEKQVKDPGTIAFNHALHLAPGQNLQPNGVSLTTVASLPKADQDFYRTPGKKDTDGIQLRCDSCHQPEGNNPSIAADHSAGFVSIRRDGAYMRPIRYERDCRACHPQGYDPRPSVPSMRHGLSYEEVGETLWQVYAAKAIESRPHLEVVRPIPGQTKESPEVEEARKEIERDVSKAEQILFSEKRCGECHTIAGETPSKSIVARSEIPTIWLRRASFDHSAHRAVGCLECHPQAAGSRTNADVMIPKSALCVNCHSARDSTSTPVAGGARFGCVECHKYHDRNGQESKARLPARDPALESSIQQFLLGVPTRGERK